MGFKNILGVKLAYKYFTSQLGLKKVKLSNWCKYILGVKSEKRMTKYKKWV